MRVSRRRFLGSAVVVPLLGAPAARLDVLTEGHCLSEESGRGFREALRGVGSRSVVVAAGFRNLSAERARELKRRVKAGEWLVFESAPDYSERQARCLAEEFGIRVSRGYRTEGWNGEYVEYEWPVRTLIRPFLGAVKVEARLWAPLARLRGSVCAARTEFGRGGIVFFGSMIGPGLLSEEREACEVVATLLRL